MQPPHIASHDYDALVAALQSRLYLFIRTMVYNKEDARDVLQDVNVVLFRKRNQYMPESPFQAWAFSIARFECLNYLKKHKRNALAELAEGHQHISEAQIATVTSNLPDSMAALQSCLKALPQPASELLQARYQSSATLEETAQQLQTSMGALKQKLFRLRSKLKQCIEQRLTSTLTPHE